MEFQQAELGDLVEEVASLRRGQILESYVPKHLEELRAKNAEIRYHIEFLKKVLHQNIRGLRSIVIDPMRNVCSDS